MIELISEVNTASQPLPQLQLFNNWDTVAKGWFIACRSRDLKAGRALSVLLCGHRLALFRGEDQKARALDAFCPHMGLDLSLGQVSKNSIQCAFHGWSFDGTGQCVDIPCLKNIPQKARTNAYAVEEKYGYVWVYPDMVAPHPVFEPDELRNKDIAFMQLAPLRRATHPHVPMVNGIDAQHLIGVHGTSTAPEVTVRQVDQNRLDVFLTMDVAADTWFGKALRFVIGPTYTYANIFIDGTLALLNTAKNVRLFGKYLMPECHLIFSLKFIERGRTEIIPFALTERRPGFIGTLITHGMLWLTRIGFEVLKAQEGEKFFQNLRFNPTGILAEHDGGIAALIAFTNRQPISAWSRNQKNQLRQQ